MSVDISVIIPLASWDTAWKDLVTDLTKLPKDLEIIFVCSKQDISLSEKLPNLGSLENHNVVWIHSDKSGRAEQLNAGADVAQGKYLWFVHADSRFSPRALVMLKKALKYFPHRLHYFRLMFLNDGPQMMFLNEWGAWLRSRVLGLPFGDQGFCISKKLFDELGGYPEEKDYGEDHLFVWQAKQQGVKLHAVNEIIRTSARKYEHKGWFRVTCEYQKLWIKQAWPQLRNMIESR